jgi:ATP-dependent DNA ligase
MGWLPGASDYPGWLRRLLSRNGHSFTNLFGPVSNALRRFPTSLLLDGGSHRDQRQGPIADFEAFQARLRPRNGRLPGHICYMVFDYLHVNGHSLLARWKIESLSFGNSLGTWNLQ